MPRVALVGAGRMGRGLAHVFAWGGWQVDLVDARARDHPAASALLRQAEAEVTRTLNLMAEFGQCDADAVPGLQGRIGYLAADALPDALSRADLVMEGVPETREAKAEALSLISAHVRAETIIASTTSTMLSTELAAHVRAPERFLNAHWLNPAYLIPLVEVSPHDGTTPEVRERLLGWLRAIGKVPVVCKASPGFIVPRIQALAMNEAARMVEEGVASAEDMDTAIRAGFGPRFAVLGLVEFIDWGGVDILHHASRYLTETTGQDRFRAPDIVGQKMAQGATGLHAGRGFHDYADVDRDAYQRDRIRDFIDVLGQRGLLAPPKA
ncbi:MAG: 3-hydroxybutyryl-CoA dehydrogenase [Minwuia sp.]|nr:3-hydroxybutyryl-CoA dehydrogenase [Minwuia sp.]